VTLPPRPFVYAILDPDVHGDVVNAAHRASAGAGLLQLRAKGWDARSIIEAGRAIKAAVRVPLIINDRADLALAAGANGVHLGQSDLPYAAARSILGPKAIIGATAFIAQHFAALDPAIVDYAGTGPVYPTLTKPNKPVLGLVDFSALVHASPVPVVGIGGITADNAAPVITAGAAGVAVLRAAESARVIQEAINP
jgi:thiamine-phosphate pyrophosphorylase